MKFLLPLLCAITIWSAADSPFTIRGYYMTFMRMPVWGLAEWEQAIDCIQEDGGNTVILWMGGGFRSAKFPITWMYNQQHKNVQQDFVRTLIDYAHGKKVRVLLGFTPFGYDGVNQLPREQPELKAKKADGTPVNMFGIHSWGWSLCPSDSRAQEFMIEYVREMIFQFYPNADGLMIESSDYDICRCSDCGPKFYEKEFYFVQTISKELWAKNPRATIMVYPHYFSGKKVNAGSSIEANAAKFPMDGRWTLFFTPHSAHLDADLVNRAGSTVYSDEGLSLGTPSTLRTGFRRAQEFKLNGYIPSLEPFSYLMPRQEFGAGEKGQRIKELGFDWMQDDQMALRQLPARLLRFAYREFTRDPQLADADFRRKAANEFFGAPERTEALDDLLFLQSCINLDRPWSWSSPLVDPELFQERSAREKWSEERVRNYRARLDRIRAIADRHSAASLKSEIEMQQIARFIVQRWDGRTP
jgi:hypothetical protein